MSIDAGYVGTLDRGYKPEEEASYIVWVDGGIYYAKSGTTGQVMSNANAATIIQASIDACELIGGTVYLKNGVYLIATQLTINDVISLIGESGGYTNEHIPGAVLKASAAIASVINIDMDHTGANDSGPTLSSFMIDGDSKANVGLLITNAVRLKVDHINIQNCLVWGLKDLFNHTHNFYSCQFSYNGAAATNPSGNVCIGDATNPANAVSFYTCAIEWGGYYGIYAARGHEVNFYSCVIEGNWNQGLYWGVSGAYFLTQLNFYSCYFEDNNQNEEADYANTCTADASYGTFQNCYFYETTANTVYSLAVLGGHTNIINSLVEGGPVIRISGGVSQLYIGNTAFISMGLWGPIRVIPTAGPTGWAATTPAVPATTVDATNTNPYPCLVYITGIGGGVTAVGITDPAGTLVSFTKTVVVGDAYHVDIGGKIRLTYAAAAPTWDWYGL